MISQRKLKKISDLSKLVGFSIITLAVIGGFFDVNILSSSIGGVGFGILLAFVVPFWMGKISKHKSFRKYL